MNTAVTFRHPRSSRDQVPPCKIPHRQEGSGRESSGLLTPYEPLPGPGGCPHNALVYKIGTLHVFIRFYEHTPPGFSDHQGKASERQTVSNYSLFAFEGRGWSEFRATRRGQREPV